MNTVLWIIAIVYAVSFIGITLLAFFSKEGYEDEDGFHYLEQEDKSSKKE
jgi:hypothetical protein